MFLTHSPRVAERRAALARSVALGGTLDETAVLALLPSALASGEVPLLQALLAGVSLPTQVASHILELGPLLDVTVSPTSEAVIRAVEREPDGDHERIGRERRHVPPPRAQGMRTRGV